MIFFAGASANQNDLVEGEVLLSGGKIIESFNGGVEFEADLESAYRFALNTHCATRMLLFIERKTGIEDFDTFYKEALTVNWEQYLCSHKTFLISQTTSDAKWIKNTHFAELRLKDAIADHMQSLYGFRPCVDKNNPDVSFHVHIKRDEVLFYLDFAGRGLSRRGYRSEETPAVMSEFLSSSVLKRCLWYKELSSDPYNHSVLLDPFCGSGTLCIEAALLSTDTAPGLINPERFSFLNQSFHDVKIWNDVINEARSKIRKSGVRIVGWDINSEAVRISNRNAARAGLSDVVSFEVRDFSKTSCEDVKNLTGDTDFRGCYIITDPPYGKRISADYDLYAMIGRILSCNFKGWNVSILCADSELLSNIDMKPWKTNVFFNGGIECQLAHYYVFTDDERRAMAERAEKRKQERLSIPLTPGAQMVANRFIKNLSSIGKQMKEKEVSCYRLYDADMPEYSVAVDLYEGKWINLQEYAPPKTIDPQSAQKRLEEAVTAIERVTDIPRENIFIKQRMIQKGKKQYTKLESLKKFNIVREHGHMFSVNFTDNLDTGIFLDHRPLRMLIEQSSAKKRFLNLFCYTGTATVYAASGGALSTVSVDSSNYYLNWAKQNMSLNGFTSMNHFYYRADVFEYLKSNNDSFDLIYCDPPTFSNGKGRGEFDVQRDHIHLIHLCMKHLSGNGVLFFSVNFTRFVMSDEIMQRYNVEDITNQTIDIDFIRHKNIHKCYKLMHKPDNHDIFRKRVRLKRENSL